MESNADVSPIKPNLRMHTSTLNVDEPDTPNYFLTKDDRFTIAALFDLNITPTIDKSELFGIRTLDSRPTPVENRNDELRLSIKNNFKGETKIIFDRHNGNLNSSVKSDIRLIDTNYDQILLMLSKKDASSNEITASYAYFNGGSMVGSILELGETGYIFNDEDGTLPLFYASSAVNVGASVVPVPAAAWLFGSGLLGLIGYSRRKKSA